MDTKKITTVAYVIIPLVLLFLASVAMVAGWLHWPPEFFVIFPLIFLLMLLSTSGRFLTLLGILMLIFSAAFLVFRIEDITNRFAVAAFIFLSFGVLKNTVYQIKNNKVE